MIKLYGIFGGYPKYYVAIEDFYLAGKSAERIIEELLLVKDAPLEDEINGILALEFGARSGLYYSILEAIANGNNTISSIAASLKAKPTSITRHMGELLNYFEFIEFEKPFSGKRGIYRIKHPLMNYWFSEVYGRYSDYAVRSPSFLERIKSNFNTMFGKAFEQTAKEFITKKLSVSSARRQWGKIKDTKQGKNTYEIDLIGKNQQSCYVFEFKFKRLSESEALAIFEKLKVKAGYVEKLPKNPLFGIVAKEIQGKSNLHSKGYLAFDLDDF